MLLVQVFLPGLSKSTPVAGGGHRKAGLSCQPQLSLERALPPPKGNPSSPALVPRCKTPDTFQLTHPPGRSGPPHGSRLPPGTAEVLSGHTGLGRGPSRAAGDRTPDHKDKVTGVPPAEGTAALLAGCLLLGTGRAFLHASSPPAPVLGQCPEACAPRVGSCALGTQSHLRGQCAHSAASLGTQSPSLSPLAVRALLSG